MADRLQQRQDWIGRTLANTYRVERELGSGGLGTVYLARHRRTGGLFAIKVLRAEVAGEPTIFRRFQDEARTTSALRHPHIVQVIDFDEDEQGLPFLVMELLDGEDLAERLHRAGPLPLASALLLAGQVGSALQAAHDIGVVHRDIKPKNIFLVRHKLPGGVLEMAKVVDFGISKIQHSNAHMTRDHVLIGTPEFMSPEAAIGQNAQVDERTDQFSLAVVLYLMLSGKSPFLADGLTGVLYRVVNEEPPSLRELVPGLPPPVAKAVKRAMCKRKEDRFPTVLEFVQALGGPPLPALFLTDPDRALAGEQPPPSLSDPGLAGLTLVEHLEELAEDPAPVQAEANLLSPTVLNWKDPPALAAAQAPASTLSGTSGQKLPLASSASSFRRRLQPTRALYGALAAVALIVLWLYHRPASRPVPMAAGVPQPHPAPVPVLPPEVHPFPPGTSVTAPAAKKTRPQKPGEKVRKRPRLDLDL